MLFQVLRIGAVALKECGMPVLTSPSLGRRALQGAAIATLAMIYPASAQQAALTPDQCRNAQIIGNAIMEKYKVSSQLAESFGKFVFSKCDMNTEWQLATDVDKKAFGEFRARIVALRTAAASPALTRQ
jgi:hypothetical protein